MTVSKPTIVGILLGLIATAANAQDKEAPALAPTAIQTAGPFLHPWATSTAVGLSPDGKILAASHYLTPPPGTVWPMFLTTRLCLWDTATGKPLRQFDDSSTRFVIALGSKTLYAGPRIRNGNWSTWYQSQYSVTVYDLATGRVVKKLPAATFALSPDGKTLATATLDPTDVDPRKGAKDKKGYMPMTCIIKLFDTATWKEIPQFRETVYAPAAMTFSNDGKTLAISSAMTTWIELFDVVKLKKVPRLTGPDSNGFNAGYHLAFSPDDKTLAATNEIWPRYSAKKTIVLWDWAAGKERLAIDAHTGAISGIGFTAEGKQLFSASDDGSCKFWEVATGKPAGKDLKVPSSFQEMALSRDGKVLAVSGTIHNNLSRPRLFELGTHKEILPPRDEDAMKLPFEPATPFPDPSAGAAMRILPNGNVLELDSKERCVRLLDAKTSKDLRKFADEWLTGFASSPDGKTLAAYVTGHDKADPVIRFWDIDTGKEHKARMSAPDLDSVFRFSPDGKTLAISHWKGTVRLWDVASGKERQLLDGLGMLEYMSHLAFSKDGARLAAANRAKTLTVIWDVSPKR